MGEQQVGVYFDALGNITKFVLPDNNNFGPHDEPGKVCVVVDQTTFMQAEKPYNIDGQAVHYDLAVSLVDAVSKKSPAIADRLSTKLEVVTTALAEAAAALAEQALVDAAPVDSIMLLGGGVGK